MVPAIIEALQSTHYESRHSRPRIQRSQLADCVFGVELRDEKPHFIRGSFGLAKTQFVEPGDGFNATQAASDGTLLARSKNTCRPW